MNLSWPVLVFPQKNLVSDHSRAQWLGRPLVRGQLDWWPPHHHNIVVETISILLQHHCVMMVPERTYFCWLLINIVYIVSIISSLSRVQNIWLLWCACSWDFTDQAYLLQCKLALKILLVFTTSSSCFTASDLFGDQFELNWAIISQWMNK